MTTNSDNAGFSNRPLKLLVLVNLLARSGGTIRALQSIDYYHRIGYKLASFLDYLSYIWSVREGFKDVASVYRKYSILPIGYEKSVSLAHIAELSPKGRRWLYSVIGELLYRCNLSKKVLLVENYKPDIIVSFHEDLPYLRLTYELKTQLLAPAITFLQLPPFYGESSREHNIEKACLLHKAVLSGGSWRSSMDILILESLLDTSTHNEDRREIVALLKSLDMVIAMSKAIAVEMKRIPKNLVCMDPGYTLDDNALDLVKKVKALNIPRGDYVVFIGRPMDCRKGLVEALIAFKYLLKEFPTLRLFVIGAVSPKFESSAYSFLRRCLRIDESKVIFTGFLNREELYKLVKGACLVLYPSHVDSFSFTVLESLMLETPVVAYRIPALEIYYGGVKKRGIWLVGEGDIGKFVGASIEVLELWRKKDVEVKPPRIRSWDDIMREEIELINRVLR